MISTTYIDEFFFAFIFGSTSLIFENNIVVPSNNFELVNTACETNSHLTYRLLTLKSDLAFSNGLPRAISCSRSASSAASLSRSYQNIKISGVFGSFEKLNPTSCSRFSARSRLIFSSSR